jgi:membrane protein DedA with SNARE-associated domain
VFDLNQAELLQYLSQYAYEPYAIYGFVILILAASSFGFPVPEEITLISSGLVAYLAKHPELYPPPEGAGPPVNAYVLAVVCFMAVIISDTLVFYIGRVGGMKLLQSPRLSKYVTSEAFKKTLQWVEKYGALMAGVFRFTPGLRFPGHMACGMLGLKPWKFLAVDGTAALLSVPTQVLAVAFYGDVILDYLKEVKIVLLIIAAIALVLFLLRRTKLVRWFFANGNPREQKNP